MVNLKFFKCQKQWEEEGPISYPFQTCHKHNKTLRLFTLKGTSFIKLSYIENHLKWKMVCQRQRQEPNKSLYVQKNFKSSIIRLGYTSTEWSRANANTSDQEEARGRRQNPNPHEITRLSHSAKFLWHRFRRPDFSVPNRTKFVMKTETPGGFCVNWHYNKECSLTRRSWL